MFDVDPKLKKVPYNRMAAVKNFQMFLSSLMIYHVFDKVVFSCSAPADGSLLGFSRIKKMIRSPLTTAAMKYFEYKLKIWDLASSPIASYSTKMAGNTRLTPKVTKLMALMIPVATVLCIKWRKLRSCQWTSKWLLLLDSSWLKAGPRRSGWHQSRPSGNRSW